MVGLEDSKEVLKSGVIYKADNNSHLDYKIADSYIIDIVHNYFCIFHAWLPTNKSERFLLDLVKYSMWSTLLLLLVFTFHELLNNSIGQLISFDFFVFWVLALASWLIQLICLVVGFWRLSPKKVETIQNRVKSELNIDTSHLTNLKSKNYFIAKFEIEKLWVANILNNAESIESLTEKVESNINHRKPTSRDIDSILLSIFKSPIIISFTAGLLIAFVTFFSKTLTSSADEVFTNTGSFGLLLFYIWLIFVVVIFGTKTLFMTFIWSLENSTRNRMFVVWRYEIFRDMLARHQRAKIKKPRLRYVPDLNNKKNMQK